MVYVHGIGFIVYGLWSKSRGLWLGSKISKEGVTSKSCLGIRIYVHGLGFIVYGLGLDLML
jgi:hypothetical protein